MTSHTTLAAPRAMGFIETLQTQRWDDHRFYHHSRINQTLHLVSALSFLCAYVFLFFDPVVAALLGWVVSMVTRQSGHFFFEPKGYDHKNQATHEHKEAIKVGYNLRRKVVLLSAWGASPLLLFVSPSLFGLMAPWSTSYEFLYNMSVMWLVLGAVAVLLRTLYLGIARGWQTGIVWCVKILTDPFHDVRIYWKAPFALLRGELHDPMTDWPEPLRRL